MHLLTLLISSEVVVPSPPAGDGVQDGPTYVVVESPLSTGVVVE